MVTLDGKGQLLSNFGYNDQFGITYFFTLNELLIHQLLKFLYFELL